MGPDPGDQEQATATCSGLRVPLGHSRESQGFWCHVLIEEIMTGLGKPHMRMKLTEQNKKPEDIDLVTRISPISYHM